MPDINNNNNKKNIYISFENGIAIGIARAIIHLLIIPRQHEFQIFFCCFTRYDHDMVSTVLVSIKQLLCGN